MIVPQLITTARICLLRAGPQDMAYSRWALVTLAIVSVALSYQMQTRLYQDVFGQADWFSVAYSFLIPYVLLSLFSVPQRFVQTLSAMLATGLVLGAFALPLSISLYQATETGQNANALVILAYLLLVLWSFIIKAHIYSQALGRSFHIGMLITIAVFIGDLLLLQLLSETPPP